MTIRIVTDAEREARKRDSQKRWKLNRTSQSGATCFIEDRSGEVKAKPQESTVRLHAIFFTES